MCARARAREISYYRNTGGGTKSYLPRAAQVSRTTAHYRYFSHSDFARGIRVRNTTREGCPMARLMTRELISIRYPTLLFLEIRQTSPEASPIVHHGKHNAEGHSSAVTG